MVYAADPAFDPPPPWYLPSYVIAVLHPTAMSFQQALTSHEALGVLHLFSKWHMELLECDAALQEEYGRSHGSSRAH